MGTRQNRIGEAVLTSTHNLCFRAKIRKNEHPCKPQFYYIKVGGRGCLLHGHVIMMKLRCEKLPFSNIFATN